MCCFFATLVLLGPRVGLLLFWLFPYGQIRFSLAFNSFIWPFLGLLFLPWTTLMYVIIFPITGFDWILMIAALFSDLASYSGGAYSNRSRLPITGRSY